MAESVILINGLPGAGKSTLAARLGEVLGVPVVSKDSIKEALADLCLGQVGSGKLGQIASETMWQLVAAVPGTAIVESWWYRPRDLGYVREGLAQSGNPRVTEVWCELPPPDWRGNDAWSGVATRFIRPETRRNATGLNGRPTRSPSAWAAPSGWTPPRRSTRRRSPASWRQQWHPNPGPAAAAARRRGDWDKLTRDLNQHRLQP